MGPPTTAPTAPGTLAVLSATFDFNVLEAILEGNLKITISRPHLSGCYACKRRQ